jgi:hypothetical protein
MGNRKTTKGQTTIYKTRQRNQVLQKGKQILLYNISVLLVAETGVPGENHRHIASH